MKVTPETLSLSLSNRHVFGTPFSRTRNKKERDKIVLVRYEYFVVV